MIISRGIALAPANDRACQNFISARLTRRVIARSRFDIPTGGACWHFRAIQRISRRNSRKPSPNEKVRLIGVDTPETVHPKRAVQCFGNNAKEFTRSMVEHRTIRLVLDETNRVRNHKDRYGRTLAYVYFDDGTMLNAELIRRGYAHAYTRFPFRHVVEFRQLERIARSQAVGLWASCRVQ